jgi:hypothetical protein
MMQKSKNQSKRSQVWTRFSLKATEDKDKDKDKQTEYQDYDKEKKRKRAKDKDKKRDYNKKCYTIDYDKQWCLSNSDPSRSIIM